MPLQPPSGESSSTGRVRVAAQRWRRASLRSGIGRREEKFAASSALPSSRPPARCLPTWRLTSASVVDRRARSTPGARRSAMPTHVPGGATDSERHRSCADRGTAVDTSVGHRRPRRGAARPRAGQGRWPTRSQRPASAWNSREYRSHRHGPCWRVRRRCEEPAGPNRDS